MNQQGDVLLFQTNDNGEINVENGIVEMTPSLDTAAYLSLFGGNEDDDGLAGSDRNWWANLDETDLARQYRSETQNLLRSIPATTSNLIRIEDAARRDLAWLLENNIASTVDVVVTMPALNTVKITIDIQAVGLESSFEFVENWKASV